jgi:hypothetical protein
MGSTATILMLVMLGGAILVHVIQMIMIAYRDIRKLPVNADIGFKSISNKLGVIAILSGWLLYFVHQKPTILASYVIVFLLAPLYLYILLKGFKSEVLLVDDEGKVV